MLTESMNYINYIIEFGDGKRGSNNSHQETMTFLLNLGVQEYKAVNLNDFKPLGERSAENKSVSTEFLTHHPWVTIIRCGNVTSKIGLLTNLVHESVCKFNTLLKIEYILIKNLYIKMSTADGSLMKWLGVCEVKNVPRQLMPPPVLWPVPGYAASWLTNSRVIYKKLLANV